ncbi:MAG: hypothetical protein HYU66_23480, partial [Armatimonadetes bacterium]|nr:hypothetical protein [Armatimonadota bacterium]
MRRLATLHLTLLLLPAAAFAQLADPSFETDPLEWELLPCDGATGTVTTVDTGRHGRALRIEKTNGLGYLMLATRRPIPLAPGKAYESALHLRVERLEFGARVYFCNQDVDAAGKGLYPVHYSPLYAQTPNFPRDDREWLRHPCRWTTLDQAAGTTLRFLVVASPTSLLLDDVELLTDPPDPVHKPVTESHEPPFSQAASRMVLARRTALPARVEMVGGRPVIAVGGRYRAALLHQGSYYSPQNSRYRGFGRSGIHLQTVCVQLGPDVERADTCWKYPDRFDFTTLEQHLLRAVGADPDVMVVLQVRCDMPRQWGLDHPADIWTAEDGRHWVTPKGDCHPGKLADHLEEGEHYMASYGSPRYLADMSAAVAELGRFVKTSEVGKLVVGLIVGGGNDGQFAGESLGLQLDHSPGHQEGFRSWLREQYDTEAALRAAWGDPAAAFATATVAPEAGRSTDRPFLRDRGPGRRVVDSVRYADVSAARLRKRLARAFKEAVGRSVVSISYYPDAVHGQGTNSYAVSELLGGPDRLDAAAMVQDYGMWRQLGATGGTTGSWAVHRLRGTLPIVEVDYRTYRSYAAGAWGMDALGATDTAEGFRSQVRRDIGAAATRGMGAWFYDMDGYWYDDPPLWSTIAEAQRIMAWAHRPASPPSTAEMAVFVDEDAGWRIGLDSYSLTNTATNTTR